MMPVPWGMRNHWDEKFHNASEKGLDGGSMSVDVSRVVEECVLVV